MKILFVYPNRYLNVGIVPGIATLAAVLKRAGHEVRVFDFTFVKTKELLAAENQSATGVFLPTKVTLEDLVREDPVTTLDAAFREELAGFEPDLICLSAMTEFFDMGIALLDGARDAFSCPVFVGGIHAIIAPEDALSPDIVDGICLGEGEDFLVELCQRLENSEEWESIRNLGFKRKGEVVFNEFRPFVDLDSLPTPDWSVFDSRHLFRPYKGNVYQGSFYLMSRGCPYRCAYCVNGPLRTRQKDCGRYFRYQSPATTIRQVTELKERYGATWFKFADDTIMTLSCDMLKELADGLEPLEIMFGCSVRPETTTDEKVKELRRMGCVAATIGVESGSAKVRREALNRKMTNDHIRTAVRILQDNDIRISTFNMVGLPGETRENAFETVRFNKELRVDSANVYTLYPYPGTEIAIDFKHDFRDADGTMIPVTEAASYAMSEMSPAEVEGIRRAFNLYMLLPESLWPVVRLAEADDETGRLVFESLTQFARTEFVGRGQ